MNKRELWEKQLNQAVAEWNAMPACGNEAVRASLYGKILELSFALFDDGTALFLDVLAETLDKFDAARGEGKFSHYLKFVWSRRKKDRLDDVSGREQQLDSIDRPVSADGGGATVGDYIPGNAADDPAEQLQLSAPFLELTSMILNFADCHQGKAANETRRNWYRLFYTEDMTAALKIASMSFLHERDVFSALKQPYLDYYMAKRCETMAAIQATPLKPYCAVVPERAGRNEETPLPIPADVLLCYLEKCEGKKATAPARSNQKAVYDNEKRNMLKC